MRPASSMTGAYVISPCTMSRSTASFAAATSSSCACRLPRRRRTASDGHRSAEDRPTRAVRDDRTGPRRAHGLAESGLAVERLAVPEPEPRWGEHITKGHYGSLVDDWLALGGLDPANHGTHSLRRTKVALVYQRTGNLRAPPPCSAIPSWTARWSVRDGSPVWLDRRRAASERTETYRGCDPRIRSARHATLLSSQGVKRWIGPSALADERRGSAYAPRAHPLGRGQHDGIGRERPVRSQPAHPRANWRARPGP